MVFSGRYKIRAFASIVDEDVTLKESKEMRKINRVTRIEVLGIIAMLIILNIF